MPYTKLVNTHSTYPHYILLIMVSLFKGDVLMALKRISVISLLFLAVLCSGIFVICFKTDVDNNTIMGLPVAEESELLAAWGGETEW